MAYKHRTDLTMGMPKGMNRMDQFPLDMSSVYYDYASMETYAKTSAISYVGQPLSLVDEENKVVTLYTIQDTEGTLKKVGTSPVGDEATISVAEDGTVSLFGIDGLTFTKTDTEGTEVDVKYQPLLVDGELTWVEVGTTTIEDVSLKISTIEGDIASLKAKDISLQEQIDNRYTKDEVANLVASAGHLKREVVETLPTGGETDPIDKDTIYMIKDASVTSGDVYEEYMLVGDVLTQIGDTSVDLSNYAEKTDLDILHEVIQTENLAVGYKYYNDAGLHPSPVEWFTYEEITDPETSNVTGYAITGFSDTWKQLDDESKRDIVIPYAIDESTELNVVSINPHAFNNTDSDITINNVVIPNTVTTIGDGAFSLQSVALYIPKSVVSMSNPLSSGKIIFEEYKPEYANLIDNTQTNSNCVIDGITPGILIDNIWASGNGISYTHFGEQAGDPQHITLAFEENAQVNFIDSVDEDQFAVDDNGNLTLLDVAQSKITGLKKSTWDASTGEFVETKEDATLADILVAASYNSDTKTGNSGLMTAEHAEKLQALVIGEGGSVEISGKVNADNVEGLQGKLDTKVDKVDGKGLSTNDFTNELLAKLTGIEAEANVNVIEVVKVNGEALTITDKAVDIAIPITSTDENKVAINADKTMEINSVNVNKLTQTDGEFLILNGGNSSLTTE